MNDTPTEAVKDARQHRFDALGFCRHVAMKKFSAGALVAATLAGSVGFAVPSNAGTTTTTTTTTVATTTTTLDTSSCGVDDGSATYNDCVQQLADQAACPDLGMTVASMTPFFDFSFQLSGTWDNSTDAPSVITNCILEPPQVGNYVPNHPESYVVDIAPWSLLEAEKSTAHWAVTKGSVKTYIGNGGKTYTLTHSIGGFGPGAEYRYQVELVNPQEPHGKIGISSNSYSLITPVGNGVLTIAGGHVPASLAVFLSYAKPIYRAAVANV